MHRRLYGRLYLLISCIRNGNGLSTHKLQKEYGTQASPFSFIFDGVRGKFSINIHVIVDLRNFLIHEM